MSNCPPAVVQRRIIRFEAGTVEERLDDLLIESTIKVLWNGKRIYSGLVTRCNLIDFVVGHLISEGFICSDADVFETSIKGDRIEVTGRDNPCNTPFRELKEAEVKAWKLIKYANIVRGMGWIYKETGSTHTGGAFVEGTLKIFHEDISRWNVADKLVGTAFRQNIHPDIVIVSSRMVSPLVKKLAHLGAPIVASVSAPTEKAVETAEEYGLTLVGFLRGNRFNIYSNEWRIIY